MSKSDRLREMQTEINDLKYQLAEKDKIIDAYKKRDNPQLSDFLKVKQ